MLIVFSSETTFEGEAQMINQLFEQGLECLHLRKLKATAENLEQLIQGVNPEFHSRIVLHQHHELHEKYQLKGVHLKENHRRALGSNMLAYCKTFQEKGYTVSSGFHDLENLKEHAKIFDYVFLSPVFDSISKKGYLGKGVEVSCRSEKIVGLGGIHSGNLTQLFELGYSGVAVLGSIWKADSPVKAFLVLQSMYKNQPAAIE